MGLFNKTKDDKIKEVLEEKEDPLLKQFPTEKHFNEEKIANILTFIYDSVTNEKIDLTDLEWSLKLDDNRKLSMKIEKI